MCPPFPTRRLQLFCVFLRFFAFRPPSQILFSIPSSSSPFPSPLQSSLPSPFPSPFPSGIRLRVPTCVCVCVCVCVYKIANNRAIRPWCYPSHSMPLALFLPREDQVYNLLVCVCACVLSFGRYVQKYFYTIVCFFLSAALATLS